MHCIVVMQLSKEFALFSYSCLEVETIKKERETWIPGLHQEAGTCQHASCMPEQGDSNFARHGQGAWQASDVHTSRRKSILALVSSPADDVIFSNLSHGGVAMAAGQFDSTLEL